MLFSLWFPKTPWAAIFLCPLSPSTLLFCSLPDRFVQVLKLAKQPLTSQQNKNNTLPLCLLDKFQTTQSYPTPSPVHVKQKNTLFTAVYQKVLTSFIVKVSFSAPANFNSFNNSGFGLTCVQKKKNRMHQLFTKQNCLYRLASSFSINLIYKHTLKSI